MTTNIIMSGALGKMGREILANAHADEHVTIVGGTEYSTHPDIGRDLGVCLGYGTIGTLLTSDITTLSCNESVVVDFSSPQNTVALLDKLAATSAAIVIGTTGLTEADTAKIHTFAKDHPVVFSPNMSLGINLLFYITELVASRLKNDFDIEIIEAHHRFKKDAPSGTAKKLGEIVADVIGKSYDDTIVNGRVGITGERTRTEVGMHAVRGGDIVGDHTVLFAGIGERIELRHMAHSRSTLARGALTAAKWLSAQKKPGLYSMKEVLGF